MTLFKYLTTIFTISLLLLLVRTTPYILRLVMILYYYCSSIVFLGFCFIISKQYIVSTEKQLSWVLTFISSLICSISSLPGIYCFWKSGYDMHWLTQNTSKDIALVCFFQVYLALDLFLGQRYYRQRINWVTGWLHHTVYLILLTWFLNCRIPSFFVCASVLEVPTLILALGALHPPWRSDRMFAFTFFALRLVLHTIMIHRLKHYHYVRPLWAIALAILPLHLYWFYGIVNLHARKLKTTQALPAAEVCMDTIKLPIVN